MFPCFYPILDTEMVLRHGLTRRDAARAILKQRVRILQFRHKGFFSREIFGDLRQIAAMCRHTGAMLVVNDRADIARLAGTGLHLGQDDLPPAEARKITGAETMIGYSTHNEAQLRAAANEPVDYLAIGPIFATGTKQNPDPVVGIDELRRLRAITDRPLVAIGGITRANARSVIEAGADSVAVIGDLFPERGAIEQRVKEWLDLLS